MSRHDDHTTRGRLGFPGGRARLPRLNGGSGAGTTAPPVEAAEERREDPAGTFSDYFTVESLFEGTPVDEDVPSDAYAILGVTRRSSWEEISKAHRRLVARLHPDRYVDADPATREHAERRVRDVNEAYSEIRRERSPSHC